MAEATAVWCIHVMHTCDAYRSWPVAAEATAVAEVAASRLVWQWGLVVAATRAARRRRGVCARWPVIDDGMLEEEEEEEED